MGWGLLHEGENLYGVKRPRGVGEWVDEQSSLNVMNGSCCSTHSNRCVLAEIVHLQSY